jgi:hypothetical protein
MDFLKDIVKEIGDDFTKLAADIDETETYVPTGRIKTAENEITISV